MSARGGEPSIYQSFLAHIPMSVRPLSADMPVIERNDGPASGGPDGAVVGEVHHHGIESLEGTDPGRDVG
jgi:hypothetical protein